MIRIDSVLNAYIDANLILGAAFLIWHLGSRAVRLVGAGPAHAGQLRLLNRLFIVLLLTPFLVMALGFYPVAEGGRRPLSLSDYMVAQYLNGQIKMKATEFETLIMMRQEFVQGVTELRSSWYAALVAAFWIGFGLALAATAASVLRLRRILSGAHPWRCVGRIELLVSDLSLVPFSTRGLRRRYVVLPSTMIQSPGDLKIALAHEFQHMRQGDLEWEVLLEFLRPVFFWNPAYYLWKRQVERLRELAVDEGLIAAGKVDIRSYCDCLLRVCEFSLFHRNMAASAAPTVPFATLDKSPFGSNSPAFLRNRIMAATVSAPRPQRRGLLAIASLLMSAVILTAAVAIQRPNGWSHDRLMLSTVVNLERLQARSTPGR